MKERREGEIAELPKNRAADSPVHWFMQPLCYQQGPFSASILRTMASKNLTAKPLSLISI